MRIGRAKDVGVDANDVAASGRQRGRAGVVVLPLVIRDEQARAVLREIVGDAEADARRCRRRRRSAFR
jgi:hypothetical protein